MYELPRAATLRVKIWAMPMLVNIEIPILKQLLRDWVR
jgi:hypothetical protein